MLVAALSGGGGSGDEGSGEGGGGGEVGGGDGGGDAWWWRGGGGDGGGGDGGGGNGGGDGGGGDGGGGDGGGGEGGGGQLEPSAGAVSWSLAVRTELRDAVAEPVPLRRDVAGAGKLERSTGRGHIDPTQRQPLAMRVPGCYMRRPTRLRTIT